MEVSDRSPKRGKPHVLCLRWTGNPTKAISQAYVAWVHSVQSQLANDWQQTIAYVFITQAHPDGEPKHGHIWTYQPGKPPKCVKAF